jgi:REP element-mobilizing transposase RayT
MRRARITYPGAFHHVMNRGIEGKDIFSDDTDKDIFLRILKEKSKKLRIRLLVYCIMNNHYHLVLQNSSGMLSDFMRELNGEYGMVYRKRKGGRGYVFQSRYKSTIIQEGAYLKMVIIYVSLNPVRAGKVLNPYEYEWSSIREYFVDENSGIQSFYKGGSETIQ